MRQAETVRETLQQMRVGFCGVKWDCLVWRMSETVWNVGESTVVTRPIQTYDLENTVKFICSVNGFIYDAPLNLRR